MGFPAHVIVRSIVLLTRWKAPATADETPRLNEGWICRPVSRWRVVVCSSSAARFPSGSGFPFDPFVGTATNNPFTFEPGSYQDVWMSDE
jgi:hypothetical protein